LVSAQCRLPSSGARIFNLAEQRFIAGQKAPVEQADRELGIGVIDLVAVLRRVHGLADAQAFIPKVAQQHGKRLFDGLPGSWIVRRQDQQVDVGIGK
jgi:hypothetical protein